MFLIITLFGGKQINLFLKMSLSITFHLFNKCNFFHFKIILECFLYLNAELFF